MKHFSNLPPIALLLFIIIYSNCSRTLYIPNTINAPLFTEKGDAKLSAASEFLAHVPTIELQGAYALTNNLGLMANFSRMEFEHDKESIPNDKHRLFELGVGYFTDFGQLTDHGKQGRAEVYIGTGWGSAQDYDLENNFCFSCPSPPTPVRNDFEGKYRRFFIQPAVGFTSNFFECSFAMRFATIEFDEFIHREAESIIEQSHLQFSTLEPVVTFSFLGTKNVKPFIQLGKVFVLNDEEAFSKVNPNYSASNHAAIGVNVKLWKQKETTKNR